MQMTIEGNGERTLFEDTVVGGKLPLCDKLYSVIPETKGILSLTLYTRIHTYIYIYT